MLFRRQKNFEFPIKWKLSLLQWKVLPNKQRPWQGSDNGATTASGPLKKLYTITLISYIDKLYAGNVDVASE